MKDIAIYLVNISFEDIIIATRVFADDIGL